MNGSTPTDSPPCPSPFGTLVEELGQIGDIETETSALLKDCNFSAEGQSVSTVLARTVLK